MKGEERLIAALNELLSDELTAINQYMVHAEMAENWGYERLHKLIQARAIVEMKHAEVLISRILFLEGQPVVSRLGPITIGQEVPEMFIHDLRAEIDAVKKYNKAIKLCMECNDSATKEILEHILKDEDSHVDEIEENQDQLAQMGTQLYLTVQVKA